MYQQIAANRRNTLLLTGCMTLLLLVVGYLFGVMLLDSPAVGLAIGLVLASIIAAVSYYNGSSILLNAVKAHEIQKADDPQLFNVVEELSIAAGVPMPKIYLIDDPAPNAFATGRDPKHSALAITKGLREKLTRDELQGVMAHELGHIENRDILYMTMLAVMVGTIVILADITRRSLWYGSSRGRSSRGGSRGSSQGQAVLMVIAVVLAVLAPLLAAIIQMAASRQREYLADATSAKLTRYPEGLASALEKIANDGEELQTPNRALQALFIVNPLDKHVPTSSLFDSHPPLEERIRRLRSMAH